MKGYKQKFLFTHQENVSRQSIPVRTRKFADILADEMNFTYEIHKLGEIDLGKIDKVFAQLGAELDLIFWKLFNANANFSNRVLGFNSFDSVKAVIPKSIKHTEGIVISSEFLYMVLMTIGTVAVIRLITFFMKFKKSTWQTFNISQIIMGIPTVEEPDNLLERIIFGSLLITCIVYTGYFYAVILNISWRLKPEISSLTELASLSLTPMMNPFMKTLLLNSSVSLIRQLAEKFIHIPGNKTNMSCSRYLDAYKNVSCVLDSSEYYVKEYEAKNGELNVRILNEAVTYFANGCVTKTLSPFFDRFSEIVPRATEFGLFESFFESNMHVQSIPQTDAIQKDTLMFVLFCILTIGYSLSIIIILLEVFTLWIKSKIWF